MLTDSFVPSFDEARTNLIDGKKVLEVSSVVLCFDSYRDMIFRRSVRPISKFEANVPGSEYQLLNPTFCKLEQRFDTICIRS